MRLAIEKQRGCLVKERFGYNLAPRSPRANTNLTCMLTGWKVADAVLRA